jgi:uncharacterized protein YcnI
MKRFLPALLLALGIMVGPRPAQAHAVVYPRKSTPGAYEKYVLRVPNEKDSPTLTVEIRFPADVRVVSFADVQGWTLRTVTDSAGRIIGAVWSGTLQPDRFVEFPFVAVNPDNAATLVWPAYQTYADGERVDWVGPPDSKRPASSTAITNPGGEIRFVRFAAFAALLLALISLGLSLRPRVATPGGQRNEH